MISVTINKATIFNTKGGKFACHYDAEAFGQQIMCYETTHSWYIMIVQPASAGM